MLIDGLQSHHCSLVRAYAPTFRVLGAYNVSIAETQRALLLLTRAERALPAPASHVTRVHWKAGGKCVCGTIREEDCVQHAFQ